MSGSMSRNCSGVIWARARQAAIRRGAIANGSRVRAALMRGSFSLLAELPLPFPEPNAVFEKTQLEISCTRPVRVQTEQKWKKEEF
jgi:hypothetical protein